MLGNQNNDVVELAAGEPHERIEPVSRADALVADHRAIAVGIGKTKAICSPALRARVMVAVENMRRNAAERGQNASPLATCVRAY